MVLFDLCIKSRVNVAIAHCNFKLRGDESDKDAEFVFEYAEKQGIAIHITEFETTQIAKQRFISIEMAARELRYNWFKELCAENGYAKIAVGHHADDSIETFMLNLARGTGISGMHGIRAINGNVIRPLLSFTRAEIANYAELNNISFREDSTNKCVQIKRNLIRHEIIGLFEQLNPSFRTNMQQTIAIMNETELIYKQKVDEIRQVCVKQSNEDIHISIDVLKTLIPLRTYLFEMIAPYGFTLTQVDNIIKALDSEPGRMFNSKTHRLLKDRAFLIVEEKMKVDSQLEYKVSLNNCPDFIEIYEMTEFPELKKSSSNIAYIDCSKLSFPLTLRRWKEGDYFYPLGLKGKKKISDFFTDIKLSRIEKEQVWILCNGNEIVWVMGFRLDERFKISSQTLKIIKFVYQNNEHI